jgi:uncharacterized protein (TIGR04255 family)
LHLPALDGACFLVDIDSSRLGSEKNPLADSVTEVMKTVDELHDEVENIFTWSVTDKLRDDVFRVVPSYSPREAVTMEPSDA